MEQEPFKKRRRRMARTERIVQRRWRTASRVWFGGEAPPYPAGRLRKWNLTHNCRCCRHRNRFPRKGEGKARQVWRFRLWQEI